jgi:hypothetical protein
MLGANTFSGIALSLIVIVANCGCSYKNITRRYYSEKNVLLSMGKTGFGPDSKWRSVTIYLEPNEHMTVFTIYVMHGQIPGLLAAEEVFFVAIPSDKILSGTVIASTEVNMYHITGPYTPGRGRIRDAVITLEKIKKNQVILNINSKVLPEYLRGRQEYRRGKSSEIFKMHGIMEEN